MRYGVSTNSRPTSSTLRSSGCAVTARRGRTKRADIEFGAATMVRYLCSALLPLLVLLVTACGASASTVAPAAATRARLTVASSVAPVVNIIFNIAGERVNLVGIIPEGTDSHTFEPAPSDAVKLSKADVMFFNGLD